MAKAGLPDIDTLRQILEYDPKTGMIFWRARPLEHFVDDVAWRTWNSRFTGVRAFCTPKADYFVGAVFYRRIFAHIMIWALHYGKWPNHKIDHVNGNGFDNAIKNLRDATPQQNSRNMQISKANKSGQTGVFWRASRSVWMASIYHQKRTVYLGEFVDFQAAVEARKDAERRYGYHANHGRTGPQTTAA